MPDVTRLATVAAVALTACKGSQASPIPDRDALAGASDTIAIVGANVLPMDREQVLRDQTIVIANGRILRMGPRTSAVVSAARTIDGRGKYLLPGLVDAHTHMRLRSDAAQFVAAGVTTIFDLGSFDESGLMALRDSIDRALILGPSILMAYFVDGPATARGRRTIQTEADARAAVSDAKRKGFQFIKAYLSIAETPALALLDEAKRQHMAVIGHGIRSIGVERGLASGQTAVAHAEEYFYAAVRDLSNVEEWTRAAQYTKSSGGYVIPNLSAYEIIERQWGRPRVLDSIIRLPRTREIGAFWRQQWSRGSYTSRPGSLDGRTQILRTFTKQLADLGVPLMVGTDAPGIPGLFPGPSVYLDCEQLRLAGLSPYQVLSAATRVPGEFVKRFVPNTVPFGVIAPGRRADLVLLGENPLENLSTIQRPLGVVVRGKWLPSTTLDSLRASGTSNIQSP